MSDQSGLGRSVTRGRGRAVRHNIQPLPGAQRPPSRGVVPGVGPVSPGSVARTLEELRLEDDSGSSEEEYGHRDHGCLDFEDDEEENGNGEDFEIGTRRRESPPTNGNSRGDTSVGLRGEGQRRERRLEDFDIIRSRPEGQIKQGSVGQPINLHTNYFEVRRSENWSLYQHRVDFVPEEDSTKTKKKLISLQKTTIGAYIFDGTVLYTPAPLCNDGEVREFTGQGDKGQDYLIRIRNVGRLDPETPMYIQFYNLVVRKCQEALKLTLMGRHYFDGSAAIELHGRRLELWPGFITVMRQHERNLLMCVEMTHKVIRQDNVMNLLATTRRQIMDNGGTMDDVKAEVAKELLGTIVTTSYNKNRTYPVDDVLWNEKPIDTFPTKTGEETYIDYYKKTYGIDIGRPGQPLIASRPKTKDIRRGMTGIIKLIPELCQMTGLTEAMRSDFRLMKDISQHLFVTPDKKLENSAKLIRRIRESSELDAELKSWGLNILPAPVPVTGRILPNEKLVLRDGRQPKLVDVDSRADWTSALRSCQMSSSVVLDYWVVIIPQRDFQGLDNLYRTIKNVSKRQGFRIEPPREIVKLQNLSPDGYSQAITQVMNKHGKNIQMLFIVLPSDKLEIYAECKRKCNVEYGIPSQCILAKNLNASKGLMSICTKVAIQMNTKLGGEPWGIQIPLKTMMFIGFDVYHNGGAKTGGTKEKSVAAMVCTTSQTFGRYFSTVSFHEERAEVSTKISSDFTKCLKAFGKVNNGSLPDRIFFYRDGVGEGQLNQVYSVELEAIKRCIEELYLEAGREAARLTFIVVTKRVKTRFVAGSRGNFVNPPPGTVVDDVVTLPERYDFYLIAHTAHQGTVSPTSYNVLWDRSGLDSDKIQRVTYKLCHMYFNWSGTVAVPAPCQYAHKLAYLTGLATKAPTHQALSHLLYFL